MSVPIESDIDRLLLLLIKQFPFRFIVEKDGGEMMVEIAPGRFIKLIRGGTWSYE